MMRKILIFSQIRDFFGVIDKNLALKQGGVYHVVIGISYFGPKQGGGCFMHGETNSHFFSDSLFFGVINKILVLKQGGVYHVVIGISDFGPKQGGCLSGEGVFGMKGTVYNTV